MKFPPAKVFPVRLIMPRCGQFPKSWSRRRRFSAISKSLALGESTVAVAAAGAEKIVDILKEIKGKVVAATGANVDHSKIKSDVKALKDQITSIIGAAQFNGMNLLNTAGGNLEVLSSLNRTSSAVTAAKITVNSVDLSRPRSDWRGRYR